MATRRHSGKGVVPAGQSNTCGVWPRPKPPKRQSPSRRSRRRGPSFRLGTIRAYLLWENPHCYYCGATVSEDTSTLDHKQPLSRGGTNKRKNLVLCCQPCNQDKGALTVEEYRQKLAGTDPARFAGRGVPERVGHEVGGEAPMDNPMIQHAILWGGLALPMPGLCL